MLKEAAAKYGVTLKDEMVKAFDRYRELLLEWNKKINLTAITDEGEIMYKHFVDSITISQFIHGGTLADVGTGAGFPGIPLKIARPELQVTLLDSLEKRVRFLNTVVTDLKLEHIEVKHFRAEEAGHLPNFREQFDYATARAVASLPVLIEYCLPFIKVGGYFIAMKGANMEEEVQQSKNALSLLGGSIEDIKKIRIEEIKAERNIILIRKVRQSSTKYPRKPGKPTKSPL